MHSIKKEITILIFSILLFSLFSRVIKADDIVPPTIIHPANLDSDNNYVDDDIDAMYYACGSNPTCLGQRISVIVTFTQPSNPSQINCFMINTGQVVHTFQYATYGFSGNITLGQIYTLRDCLKNLPPPPNGTLNFIELNRQSFGTLDYAVKMIRVNPVVWNTYNYTGSPDISVALMDSGVNIAHNDLGDPNNDNCNNTNNYEQCWSDAINRWPNNTLYKVVGWYDACKNACGDYSLSNPQDPNGHGSHTAGIIAGAGRVDNNIKGVAFNTRLVGVRILNSKEQGNLDDWIAGFDWIIGNKTNYRIKVVSASVGTWKVNTSLDTAAKTVVDNGMVLVVSAGNSFNGTFDNSDSTETKITSPGDVASAITVGAVDDYNNVTYYSSNGDTNSSKPDVVAPGGSRWGTMINSTDNFDDSFSEWMGTSFSCPMVSGLADLIIQGLGNRYNATNANALFVKSIILMTATETNKFGEYASARAKRNTPPLNRGDKDLVEGFGSINADAAIEAVLFNHTIGTSQSDYFGQNVTEKKAWARAVNLTANQRYAFILDVPSGADYDLYFYNFTPNTTTGNPTIIDKSIRNTTGTDENIVLNLSSVPNTWATGFLVAKWVSGSGNFSVYSGTKAELTLGDSEIAFPQQAREGNNTTINVTVYNLGATDANNVKVDFMIDNVSIQNKTVNISFDSNTTLSFNWIALPFNHTIGILVDPDNTVDEINENNNLAIKNIFVIPKVDLTLNESDIIPPSTIMEYIDTSITATIHNLVNYNATNAEIVLYANGTYITHKYINVPGNSSANASLDWFSPDAGVNMLTVVIAPSNNFNETNYSNNNATIAVKVHTQADWPMFLQNTNRDGFSPFNFFPRYLVPIWRIPGGPDSSPSVVDGKVFFGTGNQQIYAVNASTGSVIWNKVTGAVISSSPAIDSNMVYVGNQGNNLTAYNENDGSVIWNFSPGSATYFQSSPVVENGVLYVGSENGLTGSGNLNAVWALNSATGAKIWNYSFGNVASAIHSSPAISNGLIYVGSDDYKIYALNATNGKQVWNYTTGGYLESSTAVSNGIVYVSSADSRVYALNATTGKQIWNYSMGVGTYSSPAVAYGIVYVPSADSNIYALNATDGRKIWNYSDAFTGLRSSASIADGIVFVGSQNHMLMLDAYSGLPIWNYSTSIHHGSPAIASGNRAILFFIGDNEGYIYGFGEPELTSFNSSTLNTSVSVYGGPYLNVTIANTTDPNFGIGTNGTIGKFINISSDLGFGWAYIKIYYNDSNLSVNESALRMYYWNSTLSSWIVIPDSGVNTIENYVWANVTHFTVFTGMVQSTVSVPVITISSPVNNTTYYKVNVLLNFSITNSTPISWRGYALNNRPNITTGPINMTNSTGYFLNGWNNVTVYANDSSGNMGLSGMIYFNYCKGDATGDRHVNVLDLIKVASKLNTKCGDANYDPAIDLNDDCAINVLDLILVSSNLNAVC